MLKRITVIDSGATEFLPGSLVERSIFESENRRVVAEGLEPASGRPVLMGITKASLATESWLSAASFQETTRVLTDAAISAKSDSLLGLKENVIIGKLIPAGTGIAAVPQRRRQPDRRGAGGRVLDGRLRRVRLLRVRLRRWRPRPGRTARRLRLRRLPLAETPRPAAAHRVAASRCLGCVLGPTCDPMVERPSAAILPKWPITATACAVGDASQCRDRALARTSVAVVAGGRCLLRRARRLAAASDVVDRCAQ